MTKSSDRLNQFVERMTAALAEDTAQGMRPPIEKRRLGTVVSECGSRTSAAFLARLEDHLSAAGLYTEPPLDASALRRDDWIRFSTQPFPPDELLFPRERDLQRFVQACLGTGHFRDLRLYQEGRRTLGREFRLPDGRRIDLLCETRGISGHGDLVAIELKRGHQKGTVEQLTGYIDALQERFSGRGVRGMIIAGHEDGPSFSSLDGARAAGYDIQWYCYRVEFRPFHPTAEVAGSEGAT